MEITYITDPIFYMAAVPAMLIVGISKGGFAGTLGMLGVPIITLVISPIQAAAIILPILCTMDILGLIAYRRKADWVNLSCMVPGAIVGIFLGAVFFKYLNDDFIRILVGVIALLFTLNHWLKIKIAKGEVGPSFLKGSFWGSLSGFTSFIAHAGGPPLQFYMLPQKINKTLFVGTSVWFFFIINYVKLIPYAYLGQFSTENLGTSLLLAPLAPIGIWLGVKLHKLVPEELFYKLAYVLLFITGLKLLWDGRAGLIQFF
ncbi:sulfite exporter TauE/SafE family protein [Sneathiella limimaris]|uniref:sulfite exporter TauE/SafE family protein n=1 Tax=Sneathiella limimaris TaxID=1964213 RepID=UPI00146D6565|nr:sulfite exporter TauE/SafE family protein [Sneathiella limimaris]